MKKVLLTLCVALSLTVLLTAPALAQPFWLSDLTCDVNGSGFGDPLAKPPRPYARIEYPSGNLYVSTIYFGVANLSSVPPGTTFDCQIICFDTGADYTKPNCATTDVNGTLPATIVQGFATKANLGAVCSDLRVDLLIAPFRPGHPQPSLLPPGTRICTEGFKPLF